MQNKILVSSEEYVHALSTFQSASTLEELNNQFTDLVRNANGTVRFCIAEAYKIRKQALKIA
jgi:hypothetical protein